MLVVLLILNRLLIILFVDEKYFFLYTYILLWRYGQVVKTSASQAEIEGSTPSSAITYFKVLHKVLKSLM